MIVGNCRLDRAERDPVVVGYALCILTRGTQVGNEGPDGLRGVAQPSLGDSGSVRIRLDECLLARIQGRARDLAEGVAQTPPTRTSRAVARRPVR